MTGDRLVEDGCVEYDSNLGCHEKIKLYFPIKIILKIL